MANEKEQMLRARELIKQKRYDDARAILFTVNHPTAQQWLAKLDEIDPPFGDSGDGFASTSASAANASYSSSLPNLGAVSGGGGFSGDLPNLQPTGGVKASGGKDSIPLPLAIGIIGTVLFVGLCVLGGIYAAVNADFDFSTGAISLGGGPGRTGGNLEPSQLGQWQNGDLSDNNYRHDWTFQATRGQTITIDMTSNDFDPLLELYGPDNRMLITDDDSGSGLNSRIVYTAPSTGQYRVVATEWRPDLGIIGGDYRILIRAE